MNFEFADRVKDLHGSAIRAAFKAIARPGMISFAGGMPSPDIYPKKELAEIASDILLNNGNTALQYGITEGYAPLLEQIKVRLSKINIDTENNQVITTAGGQQGIELTTKALVNEGDTVICENPSFVGALNAFRSYNAKLCGVDMDEDGMNMEKLEDALKTHVNVKFIYTIPTFQNPTGRTMSLEKRKKILELAKKYNVFILEDNPYGELRFAGEDVPTIKSMDKDGVVIYCGSFSKIIAPGMRVGFVCALPELVEKMVVCKQVSDVHTNVLNQMIISEYLNKYDIDAHIRKSAELSGRKCALMKECIKKYFPENVTSTSPEGGIFLWCDMHNDVDGNLIASKAIDKMVAIVAGSSGMPDTSMKTCTFRLNYSMASDENIEKGIKALGEVLYEYGK